MELNKYIRQAAKNILSEQGFDEGFRVSQNPTYGQGFDDRLKKAGGFSDEEMDDITSRDIGSPFPGTDDDSGSPHSDGIRRASNLIDELRQNYRSMSDEEIDSFSKEMIEHFLDNTTAQAAAKIWFGKRNI